MIRQLARDAVRIKMAAKMESPLISVYEFCYAAGFGCKIMGLPKEKTEELSCIADFADLKQQVQDLARAQKAAFEEDPQKTRLHSLLVGCRCRGELDEDARALFEMGCEEPCGT